MGLSRRTRFLVLDRDDYTCRYCGAKPPDVTLHVDHIVPRAHGGTDDPSNLVTACAPCNLGKSHYAQGDAIAADVIRAQGEVEVADLFRLGWQPCGLCGSAFAADDTESLPGPGDTLLCRTCSRAFQYGWCEGFDVGKRRRT